VKSRRWRWIAPCSITRRVPGFPHEILVDIFRHGGGFDVARAALAALTLSLGQARTVAQARAALDQVTHRAAERLEQPEVVGRRRSLASSRRRRRG